MGAMPPPTPNGSMNRSGGVAPLGMDARPTALGGELPAPGSQDPRNATTRNYEIENRMAAAAGPRHGFAGVAPWHEEPPKTAAPPDTISDAGA